MSDRLDLSRPAQCAGEEPTMARLQAGDEVGDR
jgi:hypothetical protein